MENKLALVQRGNVFMGIVGTPTGVTAKGEMVCIGDVVTYEAGPGHNDGNGVVGIFTRRIGVMGIGSVPISQLLVTEIIFRHTDLKEGSTLMNGYFEVLPFED
ncbi:hypothetical protein D3D03_16415 [Exiguobacterium sp. RIT452]|uniref:hypothetical protein n=1 Tax=Exiguobacterium sp. RIT452 TaxID=2315552 RepID=UPI000E767A3F|nr:hypothetical protein [Exiguobacterium sp. RIT452]RJO94700.1 hypothetical protein D3D03_16415 [Exiguobacterium sp. RIT452]